MKSKRLNISPLAIITAAAILVACGGEQALLVSPPVPGAPPLGALPSPGALVQPVRRQQPMAAEVSWSFDVDARGTTVRDPSTGLTITVPAGAVAAPTHITVFALRGAPLAYRFEPHGLQFAQPIQLTQSLHGLLLGSGSQPIPRLFGGYFADDSLATDSAGNARVIEILPVQIDVRGHNVILSVRHFSGYTVASAASDSVLDRYSSWDLR